MGSDYIMIGHVCSVLNEEIKIKDFKIFIEDFRSTIMGKTGTCLIRESKDIYYDGVTGDHALRIYLDKFKITNEKKICFIIERCMQGEIYIALPYLSYLSPSKIKPKTKK